MTNEEANLVTENMNLAYKLAWEYVGKLKGFVEFDELCSICFLGLTKAAKTYDKNRKIEFSTYAYTVMKNEIFYFYYKNNNNNVSLSQELSDNLFLEDILASDIDIEDTVQTNLDIVMLHKFIAELNDSEQFIVNSYLKGCKTTYIADTLKLSPKTINQMYRKAINKLRHKFFKYQGGDIEWE